MEMVLDVSRYSLLWNAAKEDQLLLRRRAVEHDECWRWLVWVKKVPLRFSDIFPKRLGFFGPNFTCLFPVPIYARLQIFIQLSATLTKLCHIKCDHPVHIICSKCPPSAETHAFRRLHGAPRDFPWEHAWQIWTSYRIFRYFGAISI